MEKFDFNYNNAWEDSIQFNTLITEFESGREQRRTKGKEKRRFVLSFGKTTNYDNQAQEIWEFFVDHRGRAIPFLFDYKKPDGSVEEVKVRFDVDEMNREAFLTKAYTFGLPLKEVID